MIFARLKPEGMNQVSEWFSHYGWPEVPSEMYPPGKYCVVSDGLMICAGFLYKSDSPIAWMEWIVANPKCQGETRSKALDLLVAGIVEAAKASGFKRVFMSAMHDGLVNRLKTHGFSVGDQKMSQLVKEI